MNTGYRVIAAMACLLVSLCASAQVGNRPRKIVLPSPELIHCRSAECSQLWKQDPGDGGMVYPAQVLTDFVNGEVVGLTTVYDKSVSEEEIRSAIDTLYPKAAMRGLPGLWRVEAEQLVIQLSDRKDGTKQLIYLKMSRDGSLFPSAHICPEVSTTELRPPARATGQLSTTAGQITVKLLDGRNGHAINNATVGLWLGEKAIGLPDLARNTNHDGIALFQLSREQQSFMIWGISIVDCRAPKGTAKEPVYRVSYVLSHGVVAENKCGKASAQSTPGQLILFVRQPHWWEKVIWE